MAQPCEDSDISCEQFVIVAEDHCTINCDNLIGKVENVVI